MLFNMHSFAAGGSGKILHWSFNEQCGGFIGDSAGVHKAIAYGYERDNGCMNFSDGKIYYLSRYVAGELKGQSAFSVYARFTAEKDAEFDIFSLSGKYKVYVKDGQLRAYVNFDTVKRDIPLFNVETGKETETLVSVGASRIICTYSGKTKKINIDGGNSDFLTSLRCEGDTLYLKNVSINDIAVFAGERTLAQAIAAIDKNAVLAADADLVGEWHFEPD